MSTWVGWLLVLSANWLVPLIVCWSYAAWAWAVGDFVHVGFYGPFSKFRLSYKMKKWHDRLWRDWGGVGLMGFMALRDDPGPQDDAKVVRTTLHEGTHCWHWLCLGALGFVAYVGHMVFIYFFQKDKHPYLDCWSERLARRRAGQLVDVPREWWPDGTNDRWPWW